MALLQSAGTVTVSEFKSGSPSQCAVADYAHIYLDRRLTQGETAQSAIEEIADAAAKAGCLEVEIEIPTYEEKSYTGLVYPMEKYYPTWTVGDDLPWIGMARQAYLGVLGREPIVDKWTFSTNGVAIAGIHGIPCIGLGPGHEAEAHSANESCPVEHLSEAAAFYAALAALIGEKC
jgi:putative selenium metabolism hydrolase